MRVSEVKLESQGTRDPAVGSKRKKLGPHGMLMIGGSMRWRNQANSPLFLADRGAARSRGREGIGAMVNGEFGLNR